MRLRRGQGSPNELKLLKVKELQEQLGDLDDLGIAWEIVESGDNLEFVLQNFQDFLPEKQVEGQFGDLFLSSKVERDLRLFEFYSILSLRKPGLFQHILKKFEIPSPPCSYFTSMLFSCLPNKLTKFETVLVLSDTNLYYDIVEAYNNKDLNIKRESKVTRSLARCADINMEFNRPYGDANLANLENTLSRYNAEVIKCLLLDELNLFPSYSHGDIMFFAHTALKVPVEEIRSKVSDVSFNEFSRVCNLRMENAQEKG